MLPTIEELIASVNSRRVWALTRGSRVHFRSAVILVLPSRLRKKRLRDLDSLQSCDFVIRKPLCLHTLMSRGFISGLRTQIDLGLRRLNRQIPHAY